MARESVSVEKRRWAAVWSLHVTGIKDHQWAGKARTPGPTGFCTISRETRTPRTQVAECLSAQIRWKEGETLDWEDGMCRKEMEREAECDKVWVGPIHPPVHTSFSGIDLGLSSFNHLSRTILSQLKVQYTYDINFIQQRRTICMLWCGWCEVFAVTCSLWWFSLHICYSELFGG